MFRSGPRWEECVRNLAHWPPILMRLSGALGSSFWYFRGLSELDCLFWTWVLHVVFLNEVSSSTAMSGIASPLRYSCV